FSARRCRVKATMARVPSWSAPASAMAIAPVAEQAVGSAEATAPFAAAVGFAQVAATLCAALQRVLVSVSAPVRQQRLFSRAHPPQQPCSVQELVMLARSPAAAGCLSYIRAGFPALRRAHPPGTDLYARPATSSFH